MEFQAPGDRILGAGVSENEALFFSNNHGIVCMKAQKSTAEAAMEQCLSDSIMEQTSIQEVGILAVSWNVETSQCDTG